MLFLVQGLVVLVVEDEVDTRDLIVFILTSVGIVVQAVTSCKEALAVLEQSQPDLILSNISLPYEDGYTLMRDWRKREAELNREPIPAIALSGFSRADHELLAYSSGFQAYIAKPFDCDHVLATIAELKSGEADARP